MKRVMTSKDQLPLRHISNQRGVALLLTSSILLLIVPLASTSGVLEFRFDSFENPLGRDSLGRCCSESSSSPQLSSSSHHVIPSDPHHHSASCSKPCRTYFRVCLKHYQNNIDTDTPCTFGEVTTPVLGNNTFQTSGGYIVPFFFNFSWPRTFSYIVDVGHESFEGSRTIPGKNKLIYRLKMGSELNVSSDWSQKSHEMGDRSKARLNYSIRVTCDENYYGSQCSDYCRSRNDDHGHFVCSEKGQIMCLPGWQNTETYCKEPICLAGCVKDHGYCNQPNECKCRFGWEGPLCDRCVRYPGCLHGTCGKPWECQCQEGWGGLFCNQDLNFCTNHKPCKNGGSCYNSGQGSYTCRCPPNFVGKNCETEVTGCDHEPCQNGGTCTSDSTQGNYTCDCPLGYSGRNCEILASLCTTNPCTNGGTCIQGPSGYMCICPPGDFDANNNCQKFTGCHQIPCRNDGTCRQTSSGYNCSCQEGFSGNNCEINDDDCIGVVCQNGGTCRDATRGYRCQCPPGFSGIMCQNRVDLCRGYPCANGGTCIESDGLDFTCACSPGFTGKHCSTNINECDPQPCLNGGRCVDRVNEFQCFCDPPFTGSRCQFFASSNGSLDRRGDRDILFRVDSALFESPGNDLKGEKRQDEEEPGSLRIILISTGLVVSVLIPVAFMFAYCRKRKRQRKERKRDEEMAKSENEANLRKNQSLNPEDRFRGSMIINSLREEPKTVRTNNYQLNREKSATLSKLSNNEIYESNLKFAAASSSCQPSDLKTSCKSNNRHQLLKGSELTKSAGKLNVAVDNSQTWIPAASLCPYPMTTDHLPHPEGPMSPSHPVNVHSFVTSLRRHPQRQSERLPTRTLESFQPTQGSSPAVRWTGVSFMNPC